MSCVVYFKAWIDDHPQVWQMCLAAWLLWMVVFVINRKYCHFCGLGLGVSQGADATDRVTGNKDTADGDDAVDDYNEWIRRKKQESKQKLEGALKGQLEMAKNSGNEEWKKIVGRQLADLLKKGNDEELDRFLGDSVLQYVEVDPDTMKDKGISGIQRNEQSGISNIWNPTNAQSKQAHRAYLMVPAGGAPTFMPAAPAAYMDPAGTPQPQYQPQYQYGQSQQYNPWGQYGQYPQYSQYGQQPQYGYGGGYGYTGGGGTSYLNPAGNRPEPDRRNVAIIMTPSQPAPPPAASPPHRQQAQSPSRYLAPAGVVNPDAPSHPRPPPQPQHQRWTQARDPNGRAYWYDDAGHSTWVDPYAQSGPPSMGNVQTPQYPPRQQPTHNSQGQPWWDQSGAA